MKLLLSPHYDDETLFASYTLLRHHPLVVFCFAGSPRFGSRDTRIGEAKAAMSVLGCQWQEDEDGDLGERLAGFSPETVWAPFPEPDGHHDHNRVGVLAARLWPDRTAFYTTYTTNGRSTAGVPVATEPGWADLKRLALACYESQSSNPATRPHFDRPLDEYVVNP